MACYPSKFVRKAQRTYSATDTVMPWDLGTGGSRDFYVLQGGGGGVNESFGLATSED